MNLKNRPEIPRQQAAKKEDLNYESELVPHETNPVNENMTEASKALKDAERSPNRRDSRVTGNEDKIYSNRYHLPNR